MINNLLIMELTVIYFVILKVFFNNYHIIPLEKSIKRIKKIVQILNTSNIILHVYFNFGMINFLKFRGIQHTLKLFVNLIFS